MSLVGMSVPGWQKPAVPPLEETADRPDELEARLEAADVPRDDEELRPAAPAEEDFEPDLEPVVLTVDDPPIVDNVVVVLVERLEVALVLIEPALVAGPTVPLTVPVALEVTAADPMVVLTTAPLELVGAPVDPPPLELDEVLGMVKLGPVVVPTRA
jgi:hypothetical protein